MSVHGESGERRSCYAGGGVGRSDSGVERSSGGGGESIGERAREGESELRVRGYRCARTGRIDEGQALSRCGFRSC